MKYTTLHETTAAYEAVKDALARPQVALTLDNMEIHCMTLAPTPSYEMVDLGLPSGTKWAKYNVGATSETEYGNYYQYGKGADTYQVTSGQSDYSGTENPLATNVDTVAQVWGGQWHMPTQAQLNELTANTTYEWTTINGVNGGKFTAKNGSGNYIFIPAAGFYGDGSLYDVGTGGYVWSSTPDGNSLYFADGGAHGDNFNRRAGFLVRGVVG